MNLKSGLKLAIKSGYPIGLDISAGNVVVKSIYKIEEDRLTRKNAELYLKPLMPTMEDLFRENDKYLLESFNNILELKNKKWVTFYYVGDVFNPITIPISDFVRLMVDFEIK